MRSAGVVSHHSTAKKSLGAQFIAYRYDTIVSGRDAANSDDGQQEPILQERLQA
jgi:hypothetical protein